MLGQCEREKVVECQWENSTTWVVTDFALDLLGTIYFCGVAVYNKRAKKRKDKY